MQLENMSNDELIALVKRQEQELAAARADSVAIPLGEFKAAQEVQQPAPVAVETLKTIRQWVVKNRPALTISRSQTVDSYFLCLSLIDNLTAKLTFSAPEAALPSGDLVGWLRTYAGDNGYSHNDYADVMRHAAYEIERLSALVAAPVAGTSDA